jgi:RNA methyltransferase, TrmH family
LLAAGENVEARLLAEVATAAHPPRVVGIYRREDLPPPEPRAATLALWRVADPGNVGTLIRTADAFGAAVALSAGCADPTSPKALRASAGSIWRVPLLPFPDGGPAAPARRVALVAGGEARPLGAVDLTGEVAFLLGAERAGLPAAVERDIDAWIPIGGAESLNVGVAGAIALYEWRRQNGGPSTAASAGLG